jgi:hypothetical protein
VSQRAAVRKRLAVPVYVNRREFNLTQPGLRDGLPGTWVDINTDANAPGEVPRLINNETIDEGVLRELEDARQTGARLAGRAEVERGNVPGNVGAATAISMLKTESAEHRRPRVARIKGGLERTWTHGLQLISALRIEPMPYSTTDEHGNESWRSLQGLDLQGQTNVTILPEPAYDTEDERREAVRDAISPLGILDLNNLTIRRIAMRELGLPQAFYEAEKLQEEAAEREWQQFLEEGRFPVEDPSIDDHMLHADRHGRDCLSEEFRDMEDAAGWDDALSIIGHTFLTDVKAVAAQVGKPAPYIDEATGMFAMELRPAVVPVIDPMTQQPSVDPAGNPLTQQVTDAKGQPVMEPRPKLGPPQSLQDMIKNVWVDLLNRAGFKPPGTEDPEIDGKGQVDALGAVLAWRAHLEAHRLEAEARASAAMGAVAPAPGQAQPMAA